MPLTRAMKKKMESEETAQVDEIPPSQSSCPIVTRPKPPPIEYTVEHCKAFVEKPYINPLTGKSISLGGPKYTELIQACKKHYANNYEDDILINLLSEDDSFDMCKRIVNTHNQDETFMHPYHANVIPIQSDFGKRILDTCKTAHKLVMLHIHYDPQNHAIIPIKVEKRGTTLRIGNLDAAHALISALISQWTQNGREHLPKIERMITGLQKILDVALLDADAKDELQDMLFELVAIKEGIHLQRSRSNSSESSSVNSNNRSKSIDILNDLTPFSKKTRKEILQELEASCIEMRDVISYDDFEDMKKKKLQLVVAIGPKNKNGQQRCYYVKNIYKHVKASIANKQLPKDPVSKVVISHDEIENVILPKMRYLNPSVMYPGTIKRGDYPNLKLDIHTMRTATLGRNYYEVGMRRIIGRRVAYKLIFGYIPADIETESADVNSATVIAKIRELFDNGRLLNSNLHPRVHINKPISYWESGDIVWKLNHMMNELNSY